MVKFTLIIFLCLLLPRIDHVEKIALIGGGNATTLPKDSVSYRLFNVDKGFGFDIYKNGRIYIHQPMVPTWAGLQPFPSAASADRIASFITFKLRADNFNFLLQKTEVDSLMKKTAGLKNASQVSGKTAPELILTGESNFAEQIYKAIKPLEKPCLKMRWRKLGIVPFGKRGGAISFALGNNIFIGSGENKDISTSDFWCYNTVQGVWTCVCDIPGGRRISGVAFSIGNKGYIGMGSARAGNSRSYRNDFYQYDPVINLWDRKKSFPAKPRVDASAFVIGNKGYVGLGYEENYFADMYEYNPFNDSWRRIKDFGGGPVSAAVGISTGTKGFIICGDNASVNKRFVYEYIPRNDLWLKREDLPGKARYYLTGYAIDPDKFIAGCGAAEGAEIRFRDFYLYDIEKEEWSRLPDYPVSALGAFKPRGANVQGKIFMGTGASETYLNDWNVFEYYYSVRINTGDYTETTGYPLKYNGQWELFQECSSEDCFAGIALKTNQQLGNFYYGSRFVKSLRTVSLKGNGGKKLYLFPRNFSIKTEKQPQQPVSLRLFFTKNELEMALSDCNKKTGLINTLDDLKVLQCNETNPDTDPSNNSFPKNTYSFIKPKWYSYGFNGETLVAEFPVSALHSEFYLALSLR